MIPKVALTLEACSGEKVFKYPSPPWMRAVTQVLLPSRALRENVALLALPPRPSNREGGGPPVAVLPYIFAGCAERARPSSAALAVDFLIALASDGKDLLHAHLHSFPRADGSGDVRAQADHFHSPARGAQPRVTSVIPAPVPH